VNLNGNRAQANNYTLDGIDMNQGGFEGAREPWAGVYLQLHLRKSAYQQPGQLQLECRRIRQPGRLQNY
jgi:hypothetical protein